MRGPRLPQLEKALAQKQRPNTAINKINKYTLKKKKKKIAPHGQAEFIPGKQGWFSVRKSINIIHHMNTTKEKTT